MGISFKNCSFMCGFKRVGSLMRVFVVPGPNALTRISYSASSFANCLVNTAMAALDAGYAPRYFGMKRKVFEDVFTITPFVFFATMAWATACAT